MQQVLRKCNGSLSNASSWCQDYCVESIMYFRQGRFYVMVNNVICFVKFHKIWRRTIFIFLLIPKFWHILSTLLMLYIIWHRKCTVLVIKWNINLLLNFLSKIHINILFLNEFKQPKICLANSKNRSCLLIHFILYDLDPNGWNRRVWLLITIFMLLLVNNVVQKMNMQVTNTIS